MDHASLPLPPMATPLIQDPKINKLLTKTCTSKHLYHIICYPLWDIFCKVVYWKKILDFLHTSMIAFFYFVEHWFKWKDTKFIVVWISTPLCGYLSLNIHASYHLVESFMVSKHVLMQPLPTILSNHIDVYNERYTILHVNGEIIIYEI